MRNASKQARRAFGLMRSSLIVIVSALATVSPYSTCAAAPSDNSQTKIFDLASDPSFENYKQVLSQFARLHRRKSENDFCVVGYLSEDSRKNAWIIWHQGNQIILWEGLNSDLDSSRRKINLKKDVVATEADVHGSTYHVTRAWVQDLSATCNRSGVKVHVPAYHAR